MAWQRDWAGNQIINKRILVHQSELDKLQNQFRSLVLPPDPLPIMNARPEPYTIDEYGPVAIELSNTVIAQGSIVGAVLGTASLSETVSGTAVWSLIDPSGAFTINPATAVVTVASAVPLQVAGTLPILIGVTGTTPVSPNSQFLVNVIAVPVTQQDAQPLGMP